MASIKVKISPSSISGKERHIYYQITHDRMTRQIRTCHKVFEHEWDTKTSTIKMPAWINAERGKYLQSVIHCIEWDVKRLKAIIASFDKKHECYTVDNIVAKFNEHTDDLSLFHFMQSVITLLRKSNKIRTSETYSSALSSFMKFRNGQDIMLSEIDCNTMMLYQAWLERRGICPNTVSFYMRNLRAMYNRAVENGLVEQRFPFKHVYTGIDKTVKRAIPIMAIKRIKELDLALKPSLDFARDMFLFSFYTRGMSFIDMAFLKKSDLKNGFLSYRRRKTGQQLTIKWEKCMQEIIGKYTVSDGQYLLPIIKLPGTNERKQYENALRLVNNKLKIIARIIQTPMPLSTYVARHTWANIAKSKNIPISIISEGMGHNSETTTRIYLSSLDTSLIDEANKAIIKDFI